MPDRASVGGRPRRRIHLREQHGRGSYDEAARRAFEVEGQQRGLRGILHHALEALGCFRRGNRRTEIVGRMHRLPSAQALPVLVVLRDEAEDEVVAVGVVIVQVANACAFRDKAGYVLIGRATARGEVVGR